jgi:tRNA(Ile)-lysidine synthase TilS/MesJ
MSNNNFSKEDREVIKQFLLPSSKEIAQLEKVEIELNDIYYQRCDKKEFDHLIKQIEKVIRYMPEYRRWSQIRASEHDYCQLCGVPFDETGLRKEVHHTPLTLYEIVVEELRQMTETEQAFVKTTDLIDRVIEKHLSGEVMSVVICPCCHKRLHYERKEFGNEVSLEKRIQQLAEEV